MAGFGDILSNLALGASQSVRRNAGDSAFEAYTPTVVTPGGSNTQVQFNDSGAFGGDAGFVYNKTLDNLYVGSVASILPGTINRTGALVSSVVLTGGKTITISRSGNYISSFTDSTKTWTFTRNGSNQITSWAVT